MISYMQVLMMTEYVRTTIKLREDVYQTLKKEAGVKNISEKINEILIKMLFKEKKSLIRNNAKDRFIPISGIMRTTYKLLDSFAWI